MASRPLARIASIRDQPQLLERLTKAGILSTKDLLLTDNVVLMTATGLSLTDVRALVTEVSLKLSPPLVLASDIYSAQQTNQFHLQTPIEIFWNEKYLPTGWSALDEALNGGIPVGTITEICGIASTGKTQLCLQICSYTLLRAHAAASQACSVPATAGSSDTNLTQTAHDAAGTVLYIDLENRIPSKRLQEMVQYYQNTTAASNGIHSNHHSDSDLMQRVIVKKAKSCSELQSELVDIQSLVVAKKVKLIIIDNIAGLVRKDNIGQRDGSLERFIIGLTANLKNIAGECKCTVLMTNTIYDSDGSTDSVFFGNTNGNNNQNDAGFVMTNRSQLGVTLHHCITSRLVLSQLPLTVSSGSALKQVLIVEKSIHVKNNVIPYTISKGGLC